MKPFLYSQALTIFVFFMQVSFAQAYVYDEISDPNEVLMSALNKAKDSNKNIIMQLGANWCGDAKKLDTFYLENPELEKTITENFIFIRVNVHTDNSFSGFYENIPYFSWVPTIMILDSEGVFLEVIDGRDLEIEGTYNTETILSLIAPFQKI